MDRKTKTQENAGMLLFGGTTEGRELASALTARGYPVTVCVATQTGAEQLPSDDPLMDVRIGRLDEAAMETLMGAGFARIVDATHPYATAVSANVRRAAFQANVPYTRIIRPRIDFGDCRTAESVEDACASVGSDGGTVLAATGNKEIWAYRVIPGFPERVFARVLPDEDSVESCRAAGLPDDHIITGQGPFSAEDNRALIEKHGIGIMITKESGAAGGFPEKLAAARDCGCAVIVVTRPQDEDGLLPDEFLASLEGTARATEACTDERSAS